MKNQTSKQTVDTTKVASIAILFITSLAIIVLGAVFSVYSVLNSISFTVMSSQIHGAVFGVVIAFLGARYFASVLKLKSEVYKDTSRFSWSNFKTEKNKKTS